MESMNYRSIAHTKKGKQKQAENSTAASALIGCEALPGTPRRGPELKTYY